MTGMLTNLTTGEMVTHGAADGPLETAQADLFGLLATWQERRVDPAVALAALADAEAWIVNAMKLPHDVERTALLDMGRRTINTLLRLKRLEHLDRTPAQGSA